MRTVKITIKPDGSTTIDASGFQGKTCLKELEDLEKFLELHGIESKVSEQTLKSEVGIHVRDTVRY